MTAILIFFFGHWFLSVFCQTFFLHRYGAHQMFTMSKGWERFFHLLTFISQGSSYLNPRGYAILHREHHAFSDTPRDPHSPHVYTNLFTMMVQTLKRYQGFNHRKIDPEPRFDGYSPEWPAIDKFGKTWPAHLLFIGLYVGYYAAFAPSVGWYLLLPVHFLMGPIHGAIVNWCGHKYGYRNFETTADDRSRNTLVLDFLTMGELFQNNHHKFGMSPNFAARWFEFDPTYPIIRLLSALGIIDLGTSPQVARYPAS
ncbi:MAG: acyl-CoA desaturase [Myxococcales bacterium]|nr:acyl-CoA desaturase [Myxococcales bacterium]MDD9965886.1 acyl-CoA desaturase [Myxococcales bacterium]